MPVLSEENLATDVAARWRDAMFRGDFDEAWRQTDRIELPRRWGEKPDGTASLTIFHGTARNSVASTCSRAACTGSAIPCSFLCSVDSLSRKGRAPRIVSPAANELLVARSNAASVILKARADGDVRTVYWFEGTKFLGSSPPGQAFIWSAKAGEWEFVALDDQGRQSTRSVKVLAESR